VFKRLFYQIYNNTAYIKHVFCCCFFISMLPEILKRSSNKYPFSCCCKGTKTHLRQMLKAWNKHPTVVEHLSCEPEVIGSILNCDVLKTHGCKFSGIYLKFRVFVTNNTMFYYYVANWFKLTVLMIFNWHQCRRCKYGTRCSWGKLL